MQHYQSRKEDSTWEEATEKSIITSNQQRPRSQLVFQSSSPPPLIKHSHSEDESHKHRHILSKLNNKKVKEVVLQKQDHTLRKILCCVIIFLLVIFAIDIRNYINKEHHRLELEAKHCKSEYLQNQCEHAVNAIKEKCRHLNVCFSTPIQLKIKISQLAFNLMESTLNNLIQSAGLAGTFFILVLSCAILYFVYKSSKQAVVIKQH